jgi:hypothetical protein
MKVKNFPGRKNTRRIAALDRLPADRPHSIAAFSTDKERAALTRVIVPEGTARRITKKSRIDRAKEKKNN